MRNDIRAQLISEAVFKKVTKDVKVDDGEVHDYYIAHPQLYSKAADARRAPHPRQVEGAAPTRSTRS